MIIADLVISAGIESKWSLNAKQMCIVDLVVSAGIASNWNLNVERGYC